MSERCDVRLYERSGRCQGVDGHSGHHWFRGVFDRVWWTSREPLEPPLSFPVVQVPEDGVRPVAGEIGADPGVPG